MDAGSIGRACVALGGGRAKASDAVDFAVGFDRIRKVGSAVERGEPLLRIHARGESDLRSVLPQLTSGIVIE